MPHLRRFVISSLRAFALAGLGFALFLSALPCAAVAAKPEGPPAKADPFRNRAASELVRRIQASLQAIGLYQGPLDGRMSAEVEGAIKAFQRLSGVAEDGRPTENLARLLDTGEKVGELLGKLEQARRQNIDSARQALLAHPATRDLVVDALSEKADPTRDTAPCFRDPTVRCLLAEAAESSKLVAKQELRDWALGEILVAQARAGLNDAARETVRRIRDPRLIMVALRDIAEAQAQAGRNAEALVTAGVIPDDVKRAEAYAAIAEIQVRRGDGAGARTTVAQLVAFVDSLDDPVKRVSFRARAAVALSRAGDGEGAAENLKRAEETARTETPTANTGMALRHVASALADLRQTDQAMAVLKDLRDDSDRMPVLMTAAQRQAEAGDAAAALATADSIDEVRYRALVLGRIAVAQARAGDWDKAETTVETALAAVERIKFPFARAYAFSRIVVALADMGAGGVDTERKTRAFDRAVETARQITDDSLRAQTLWSVAGMRRRNGDEAGARTADEAAEAATAEIKSGMSRVWVFAEVAVAHARAAEPDAAWKAFRRGLAIAEAIDNPWGRARTLARLAQTLVQLVEAPALPAIRGTPPTPAVTSPQNPG